MNGKKARVLRRAAGELVTSRKLGWQWVSRSVYQRLKTLYKQGAHK